MNTKTRNILACDFREELAAILHETCTELGETPSTFIRKAVVVALQSHGKPATLAMSAPPSRKGKGGRPSHKKQPSN